MKSETRITPEQYLHFYEDPWRSNLIRAHLNQIIVMHGFIKLHNVPKVSTSLSMFLFLFNTLVFGFGLGFRTPSVFSCVQVLMQESLGSIELIPPTRSTLDEDISSGALLTMAEVAEDLAALGWNECAVRSLWTLKPAADLEHFTAAESDLPFIAASSTADQLPRPQPCPRRRRLRERFRAPPAGFVIMGRRPRSKRKRVSINAVTAADLFATSSPSTASSFPPPPSTPPPGLRSHRRPRHR
ncbi:uncharacterized protein LOC103700991 isoform X1 [Phoenix dactylifera]|uniref:Uncharacterized protein LOC103700991 isoform X1 n=1 Tax=Phoenix dactylifera TaxID=42345 RepID=A0A8B7MT45_PHODC|nr:uncharacterized protein LOC103700991 isoform X1 [Phoenix dactylifera]